MKLEKFSIPSAELGVGLEIVAAKPLGEGTFVAAPMGHALMIKPALWANHLDRYLHELTA